METRQRCIHLKTRKDYGHIDDEWELEDYNDLIMTIVNDPSSEFYFYPSFLPNKYFVLGDGKWIVMFGIDGTMETCFPPSNYDEYIEGKFLYLGTVEEVLEEWM
ncbi:hypothetical protein [Ammoniphilus sp. 3BR4]|uniref:hypothetical protein n=1 Tax=Ammoniphilus sp. 3BR4 TaxID=3158265 RepID=UPI003465FD9E